MLQPVMISPVVGLERRADLEMREVRDRVLPRGAAAPRCDAASHQSRPMIPPSSAMNCPFTCCAVSITSE